MSEPAAQNMLESLRSDHTAVSAMLADATVGEETSEGRLAREELVIDLVRHFVAEEEYLFPTVRAHVEGGDHHADVEYAADRSIETQLKELEAHDLTPAALAELLHRLAIAFAAHIERQETLFAILVETCEAQDLLELGEKIRGAEQLAPTHPRTVASSSAGLSKATNLIEGFFDEVRDYYTHRGARP